MDSLRQIAKGAADVRQFLCEETAAVVAEAAAIAEVAPLAEVAATAAVESVAAAEMAAKGAGAMEWEVDEEMQRSVMALWNPKTMPSTSYSMEVARGRTARREVAGGRQVVVVWLGERTATAMAVTQRELAREEPAPNVASDYFRLWMRRLCSGVGC